MTSLKNSQVFGDRPRKIYILRIRIKKFPSWWGLRVGVIAYWNPFPLPYMENFPKERHELITLEFIRDHYNFTLSALLSNTKNLPWLSKRDFCWGIWVVCGWRDSNSHSVSHTPLKRTCLPIPPHPLGCVFHFNNRSIAFLNLPRAKLKKLFGLSSRYAWNAHKIRKTAQEKESWRSPIFACFRHFTGIDIARWGRQDFRGEPRVLAQGVPGMVHRDWQGVLVLSLVLP